MLSVFLCSIKYQNLLPIARIPKRSQFVYRPNHIAPLKQNKSLSINIRTNYHSSQFHSIRNLLNKTTKPVSCIYLFSIGTVKNLRKTFNIDYHYLDEDRVCKWGMTNNLLRRSIEHNNTYGKIPNACLELIHFEIIDPEYIREAEKKIKEVFINMGFKCDFNGRKELAVIPIKNMEFVRNQFKLISDEYLFDHQKLMEKHKNELLAKDNDVLKKEIRFLKKELQTKK